MRRSLILSVLFCNVFCGATLSYPLCDKDQVFRVIIASVDDGRRYHTFAGHGPGNNSLVLLKSDIEESECVSNQLYEKLRPILGRHPLLVSKTPDQKVIIKLGEKEIMRGLAQERERQTFFLEEFENIKFYFYGEYVVSSHSIFPLFETQEKNVCFSKVAIFQKKQSQSSIYPDRPAYTQGAFVVNDDDSAVFDKMFEKSTVVLPHPEPLLVDTKHLCYFDSIRLSKRTGLLKLQSRHISSASMTAIPSDVISCLVRVQKLPVSVGSFAFPFSVSLVQLRYQKHRGKQEGWGIGPVIEEACEFHKYDEKNKKKIEFVKEMIQGYPRSKKCEMTPVVPFLFTKLSVEVDNASIGRYFIDLVKEEPASASYSELTEYSVHKFRVILQA